jgi:competence protein ComEC
MQLIKKIFVITFLYYVFYIIYCLIFIPRNTTISFFNVGQGDSIFINTSRSRGILVDGGPDYELDLKLQKYSPFPFCNVSLIFLTHLHADHYAGISRFLNRCNAPLVTFNDISLAYTNTEQTSLKNFLANNTNKNNWIPYFDGEKFTIDNIKLYPVWPKSYTQLSEEDENINSLVLLVVYKNFSALLTGDAPKSILEKLDFAKISGLLNTQLTVYKVPHHGSLTGYSLITLRLLKPKVCIISVGKNPYNLPNNKVLPLLKQNCDVLRTDYQGNIEFKL